MIIEIRRHGEYDRQTKKLTLKSKTEAMRISSGTNYDEVFSAQPLRCVETAEIFGCSNHPVTRKEFDDIKSGEDIKERIEKIIQIMRIYNLAKKHVQSRVLIITHSNLIASIDYFHDGKKIPHNLDDLPMVPHLKGIRINISILKQKV